MRHRWRDSWQRSGLPSLTHRIRAAIAEQAASYAAHLEASASRSSSGSRSAGSGGSSSGLFSSDGEAGAESEGPLARMYALLYGRSEGGESSASGSSGGASTDGWMLGEPQQGVAGTAEAAGATAVAAAPELLWDAGSPAGQPGSGAGEAGQQQQQQWRRQGVLRMLRGTVRSKLAGARPAAAPAADLAGAELSVLSMGLPGVASSAAQEPGPAQLRALMAAAADYSAERAQRMRQLLGGRLAAPDAHARPSIA